MSSPTLLPFAPRFLLPSEYAGFGLPSSAQQPDIDNIVQLASEMIDAHCGRTDGDGSGSLVYTTYQERILSQSPGRNINYLPHRPLAEVTPTQQALLMASGFAASASGWGTQPFYTGFIPSPTIFPDGRQSCLVGASGRYAFPRRDTYPMSNDPYAFVNPLTIITLFGGPPPWIGVDQINIDYDVSTGEIWIASGMWLERYTEVIFQYNSGYDPTRMPSKIKQATAALAKNIMMQGAGTTGMKSFSLGKSGMSAQFSDDMIDRNIERLLAAYLTVRCY